MKRAIYFVPLLMVLYSLASFAEEPVYFPDANLKAAVEAAVGKTSPTSTDMLGLTYFYASYSGISDLTGLEYATNLRYLYLPSNQISDISPLTALTNLSSLSLPNNRISYISPLAGLTNLDVLDLSSNQISDIGPLAGLANLVALVLYTNQISDISPLAGLTNLDRLWLYFNQISDIDPLAGLTNLTYLNLDNNHMSDISPLAGLTNLVTLFLSYNQISDISPLGALTNLERLGLYYNPISDISPLAGLKNLGGLFLGDNQISDIRPLAGLTNLGELHLYGNQISDISALSSLTNLYQLNLTQNPLNCPAYDIHIPMIETNNPGLYLTYDPRPAYCDYQPDIDVSPAVYDFGDVELETYRSALITISNTGNGDLTAESLAFAPDSSLDFVLVPPELPAVIPPEGSIDVEVLFAPTTEGLLTAILKIGSNDYDEPVVQVNLLGVGVVIDVAPDEQIKQITELIETSVAEGTLAGSGPGNSPTKRVSALINMLESTSDLIVGGHYDDAYAQLVDILKKCDGQVPPPDFADGEAREELTEMITELMEDLAGAKSGLIP